MTAKNPQKQGRILMGGGQEFFWLARIYTPDYLSTTRELLITICRASLLILKGHFFRGLYLGRIVSEKYT